MNDFLQFVVGHCYGSSAEGVGLDNVAACIEVSPVNVPYDLGSGKT